MTLSGFLSRLRGVKKVNGGYMALCPAHNDHDPSLFISVSEDGERILIHCFAGCSEEEVLAAMGLKPSDLFTRKAEKQPKTTEYLYHRADGTLCYTKTRLDKADGTKGFYFTQPNGTKGLKGVQRVPYNLPAVKTADKVYFVEGEKCADAVIRQGCTATTLDSGANSKWLPEYTQYFEGKEVIIIPDNDKPGMEYARKIAQHIPNAVIKQLPGLGEKEDIFDWLASGHTMSEVDALPTTELSDEKKDEDCPEERGTQAETMMALYNKSGAKVFRDETNSVYAAVPVGSHWENIPVDSRDFSSWLQGLYYRATKRPIRQESLTQVIATISAIARFDSQEHIRLYNRVAAHQGDIWYDLCNPSWQAVKVSAGRWTVENTPPVIFKRYRHQAPQVTPQPNGDIYKIFQYVNIKKYQTLFLCWLVTCFVPDISHPMPIIYGEKGAAKSTACVLLKRLIDPSALDTLTLHSDQRSLVVNLQQHWFLPFDNVSNINGETSDMLCRAITGASIQQRKLCTDADDYIFTFMRCLAINGINNVANRADLLDRSLLFELERVPETERKAMSAINQAFETDRPVILGGIFDILSIAMEFIGSVELDKLPRMADFCRWGYAVAEALGGFGEQFLCEYEYNRALQNTEAIAADAVATLTIAFMSDKERWSGLVSSLLGVLVELAPAYGISKNAKSLPSQPNYLSRRLNELKSNLEAVGITFKRDTKTAGTFITLYNANSSPLPSYGAEPGAFLEKLHGGKSRANSIPGELPPYQKPSPVTKNGDDGDDGDDSDDVQF